MSKGNQFENDWLKLIFNGTPIPNIADNASVLPLASLTVALHLEDPGETGNQATNEATYPGYSRVPVARTTAGWTVTNNVVSPAAPILFSSAGVGTVQQTVKFVSVGVSMSGATKILYKGALSPQILVVENSTPHLRTTSTISED